MNFQVLLIFVRIFSCFSSLIQAFLMRFSFITLKFLSTFISINKYPLKSFNEAKKIIKIDKFPLKISIIQNPHSSARFSFCLYQNHSLIFPHLLFPFLFRFCRFISLFFGRVIALLPIKMKHEKKMKVLLSRAFRVLWHFFDKGFCWRCFWVMRKWGSGSIYRKFCHDLIVN